MPVYLFNIYARATLLSLLFCSIGCATVINGTHQDFGISSSPTGAKISINNQDYGTTPLVTELVRDENHVVRIELDSYQPYEITLTKSVSGWVWGNILIGGLIGLAVDAISGGIYKLTPEQVVATLDEKKVAWVSDDFLMLTVVLEPEIGWEKIGALTPSSIN